MRISVMAPAYVPAHKAGGPVPGIVGVVESLHDQDVHVYASDRDLGETEPFPPPYRGTTQVGGATVTYLPPPARRTMRAWVTALQEVRRSDLVYFNSLMARPFTIFPLLLLWATRYPGQVAISPRGELASSALRLGGSRQKQLWIRLLRILRLDLRLGRRPVTWVASSDHEKDDIERVFTQARVVVVPERLRPRADSERAVTSLVAGLHVVSVGRLAPVKGHDRFLRGLARTQRPITARIIGPPEDAAHVVELDAIAATLPQSAAVEMTGSVVPDDVELALEEAHLFVLLTHGENFGHAIGEALRAGCPVLISDQTTWSGVAEAGAGVVLSAAACEDPGAVAEALDRFAALSDTEWQAWSRRAQEFIASLPAQTTLLQAMYESGPR